MTLDENTLKKIRDYAAIGHTPGQIASLLRVSYREREMFLDEFTRIDTKVNQYYQEGIAMMDYNVNVELARAAEKGEIEAIEALDKRNQAQKVGELLADLFGIYR